MKSRPALIPGQQAELDLATDTPHSIPLVDVRCAKCREQVGFVIENIIEQDGAFLETRQAHIVLHLSQPNPNERKLRSAGWKRGTYAERMWVDVVLDGVTAPLTPDVLQAHCPKCGTRNVMTRDVLKKAKEAAADPRPRPPVRHAV